MNSFATLTRRENEIAELIAWGASKKDIANHIFRSIRTVENIARSVYEKTGVTKSNELSARWFCEHYNIPLSLSPLKKSIIALLFLLIFIPFEITSGANTLRFRRTRITEIRRIDRCREEETLFEI